MKTKNLRREEEASNFMALSNDVIEKLTAEEVIEVKGGGNPPEDDIINNGNGCKC